MALEVSFFYGSLDDSRLSRRSLGQSSRQYRINSQISVYVPNIHERISAIFDSLCMYLLLLVQWTSMFPQADYTELSERIDTSVDAFPVEAILYLRRTGFGISVETPTLYGRFDKYKAILWLFVETAKKFETQFVHS